MTQQVLSRHTRSTTKCNPKFYASPQFLNFPMCSGHRKRVVASSAPSFAFGSISDVTSPQQALPPHSTAGMDIHQRRPFSTTALIINNKQRTAHCAELCDAPAALRGEKPGRGTAARRLPTCHTAWQGPKPWPQARALTPGQRALPGMGLLSGPRRPSDGFSPSSSVGWPAADNGQTARCGAEWFPSGKPHTRLGPGALPHTSQPPPAAQPSHTDGPRLPSRDPPARPPSPGGTRLPRPSSPRHLLPTAGGGGGRAEPVGRISGRSSPPRSPHLRRGGELPPAAAADGDAVPGAPTPPRPAAPLRDSHFCFCPNREGAGSRDTTTPPPPSPARPGRWR